MIAQLLNSFRRNESGLPASRLFNEQTFYKTFEQDLARCQKEAIIESPFMTCKRTKSLLPTLEKAIARNVEITVNTKSPQEVGDLMRIEAERCIAQLQEIGVNVLFTGGHHRKLAIFDRQILWEGSLNILSQNESCEIMKRTYSERYANQVLDFIKIKHYL